MQRSHLRNVLKMGLQKSPLLSALFVRADAVTRIGLSAFYLDFVPAVDLLEQYTSSSMPRSDSTSEVMREVAQLASLLRVRLSNSTNRYSNQQRSLVRYVPWYTRLPIQRDIGCGISLRIDA